MKVKIANRNNLKSQMKPNMEIYHNQQTKPQMLFPGIWLRLKIPRKLKMRLRS
jgi:hypothetical protein